MGGQKDGSMKKSNEAEEITKSLKVIESTAHHEREDSSVRVSQADKTSMTAMI